MPTTNNSSFARWVRRRSSNYVSTQSPIVIGGSQRSGTTLLRVMLDSHPHIACGPETSLLAGGFLPDKLARRFDTTLEHVAELHGAANDHAQFVELFLSDYATRRGKQRWAEKTPQNIRHIGWILARFPKAKIIHVLRDGRDTVCSIRIHPRFRVVDGEKVPTGIRRPLESCIQSWLRDTAAGIQWRGSPQYMEVRYEDLVAAPENTLRKLCTFLGEPWAEAMLHYHEERGSSRDPISFITNVAATEPLKTGAVGRWKTDLTGDELKLFYSLASARMTELGYNLDES